MSLAHDVALAEAFTVERRLLQTRIERLAALCREHGIPLPEDDPRLGVSDGEHQAACRRVVECAYALLERRDQVSAFALSGALDELRELVGSGVEMLDERSWRR